MKSFVKSLVDLINKFMTCITNDTFFYYIHNNCRLVSMLRRVTCISSDVCPVIEVVEREAMQRIYSQRKAFAGHQRSIDIVFALYRANN